MPQQIIPHNGTYFASHDFENGATPEVEAIYDECVTKILDGTFKIGKPPYKKGYAFPDCFLTASGPVFTTSVPQYYLYKLSRTGFSYEKAYEFCETYRRRFGWNDFY